MISFKTSNADRDLIEKIVDRAHKGFEEVAPGRFDRLTITMDITACHANGNPLRLADLLAADDFNFFHDIGGIARYIDRDTGKLTDLFSPRFTARTEAAA